MFEKVDNQVNFVLVEHEVLKFWEETDAFNKLREINAGKEPWSFLDGPITANNPMGVHHAWGRTWKDVFQRYYAMNRRDLRYQNGFDCQGLWVELEVEKQLGLKTKKAIEDFGLDKFTEACKERVRKYSGIQTRQSKRLGYWMDWDDSYFTMSEENNYTIWRFLKECHRRGFLYKGTDVMPWSGRAGSAYSDMEVKEGRKLTVHTSVFVRFPLRGRENEYLLIWTTTPWTLTSNVGAAVNSDLEYVKLRAKKDGALYYFAKANLEFQRLEKEHKEGFPPFGKWPDKMNKLKTIAQIFKEQGGYDLEGTVKGSEMVGWTYDGPFDHLPAQQHQGGWADNFDGLIPDAQKEWPCAKDAHVIIDPGKDTKGNAYVVAGEGTGIVHTAPGCGDVDHVWGEKFKLVSIAPLNADGKYIDGFGQFTGMDPVDKATTDALLADMKERGFLVAKEEYPHIYPHCWRTGDELVYRLVDEWFISMEWREEIMKTVREAEWHPAQMKGEERELDWLRTMKDWMISKKRYWGLALPIWQCTACQHVHVIGSREELQSKVVEGWDMFEGHTPHRPYVDAVKIKCEKCGELVSRIPDVGNPWLDAGIVAYSTTRFNQDRAYWEKWMPADLILECFPGQFRNWFYAILTMSTMMEMLREREAEEAGVTDFERQPPFHNLLGHALVADENGNEMHKSDGTAIWFEEAAEQLGVDTMRWMYCSQRPIEDLKFGLRNPKKEVTVTGPDGQPMTHTVDGVRLCEVTSTPARETRRRVLMTLWNCYSFFANYAALDGFDPASPAVPMDERSDFDRWIISELHLLIGHVRNGVESFELAAGAYAVEQFIDDLSNWYIRLNRPRFWSKRGAGDAAAERDKLAAYQTLHTVLLTLTKLMAPMVPFVTEKMYQNLARSNDDTAPASVHHCEFPEVNRELIDDELSEEMSAVMLLVQLGRQVRTNEKINTRQPLAAVEVVSKDPTARAGANRFREQILAELNVKQLIVREEPAAEGAAITPNLKALARFGKETKAAAEVVGLLAGDVAAPKLLAGEEIPVLIGDNMKAITLADVYIAPAGFVPTADAVATVSLDVRLNDELRREGLAREVVRALQDLRKKIGLEIEDRIVLRVDDSEPELAAVFDAHLESIAADLLATSAQRKLGSGDVHTVEVRKKPALSLKAQIEKA